MRQAEAAGGARAAAIVARVSRRSRSSTSMCMLAGRRWWAWSRPQGEGMEQNQRNNPMRVRRPDKERAPAGWRPRPLVLTGDPLGAGLLGGAALAPFFVVVAFRIYLPYRWGCEESGPWQMQVPGLREACISSQPEGHLSLPST